MTLAHESAPRAHSSALWTALLLLVGLASSGRAGTYPVLGPETFSHAGGPSSVATRDFAAASPGADFTLRLDAGHDSERPPTSVVVSLNGQQILSTHISRRRPVTLTRAVSLAADNHLEVVLGGRRGTLDIGIFGDDGEPPTIAGSVSPFPNAAGWNAGPVTVSFACDDAESGIASCTAPIAVAAEGPNQVVTGTAVDLAGNSASTAVAVSIDVTPPTLVVDAPIDGSEVTLSPAETSGFASDVPSGIAMAEVNGVPLALANGEFEQQVPLASGLNVLLYRVEDLAGNVTTELVGVELVAHSIALEVLSPGDGSIQYNSGWPLSLRLTMRDPLVGLDVYDFARNRSRDTVPQAHDAGPFPRSGQAGVVVFEDPDGCPSFKSHEVSPNSILEQPCLERVFGDEFDQLVIGEIVPCGGTCSDGTVLPACGTFQEFMRCPDETALRFRPGIGFGRGGLPALVLLSDTGSGRRVEDGQLIADNLAAWDGVSYELRDGRGELSITTYHDVPFVAFGPVVEYDDEISAPSPCDSDTACYTIDGGPLCPNASEPACDVLGPREDPGDFPNEPRIAEVYARIFAGKPVTLRAFVVDLGNPFDEVGIDQLADENGDGVVDGSDAEAAGWALLSNEVVIRLTRRLYGNPCESGTGDLFQLFGPADLDGNGLPASFDDLFDRCGGDDSSPVESPRPPP